MRLRQVSPLVLVLECGTRGTLRRLESGRSSHARHRPRSQARRSREQRAPKPEGLLAQLGLAAAPPRWSRKLSRASSTRWLSEPSHDLLLIVHIETPLTALL
jgi:hypothetical protein